ncbi:MAG: hypothetical protein ACYCVB_02420 [Bacilli bacterium]
MKEFIALKAMDRLRSVFETLGCDYPAMRQIVQVKLTMDRRRVPTILQGTARRKNRPESEDKNSFAPSLLLYAFMGLLTAPLVLMKQNYMFSMGVTFGVLMFLVMTSMIADFSSVLLDVRDRVIISTKPVNRRTMSFARTVHIMIYLFLLTGSLAGAPLLAALFAHGVVFFLVFLLEILLMDIFILVVTALLYLLILSFFDGERLKDIINYVQIALSIAIAVGYQAVGRSFDVIRLHIVFHTAWWQVAVPPFWFGSTFEWIMRGHASPLLMLFSTLAIIVPIVSLAAYIQLMPAFERKLQKLSSSSARGGMKKRAWSQAISRIICAGNEERAFFAFASVMMAREREFKLKVYPALGFAMVLPFIVIFNSAWSNGLKDLASSRWYLSIYVSAMMIPSVVLMLRYSGQYRAAWVYRTAPVQSVAAIFKGTIKAFLMRLFLPIYLVESVVFVAIFGIHIIPDLVVACLSMLLYAVICLQFTRTSLPFSEPFQVVQQSQRYVGLLLLLLIGVFAAIHFVFTLIPFGVYIYMFLLVLLNGAVWGAGVGFRNEKLLYDPTSRLYSSQRGE